MDERFSRQQAFFGADGQARLGELWIVIVGLGGLGCHVGQQLGYAGIRFFDLIDRDTVTRSSLNRLVGATQADVDAEVPKVTVAARLISGIDPAAGVQVHEIADSFISERGFQAIRGADYVFGCMDRDAPRLILNEVCQAYRKPYFDLASDVATKPPFWFGGRVLFSRDGEMCVMCKDLLDQRAIRLAFASERQLEEEERIYGVPRALLGETGPAVVSLNGLVASAAVTEFLMDVSGIRPAQRSLEYIGMRGVLTTDRTEPKPDCFYCKGLYGTGGAADVERYIREGYGTRM